MFRIEKDIVLFSRPQRQVSSGYLTSPDSPTPTTCIVKTFVSDAERLKEYANFCICQNAGLPTPQFCLTQDDMLILPDLTENGKYSVISTNTFANCLSSPDDPQSPFQDRQNNFDTRLTGQIDTRQINYGSIQYQIKNIINQAASAGIILHCDSYFFIINQQGNVRVVVGDFGNIQTIEGNPVPPLLEDNITPGQWCAIKSSFYAQDLTQGLEAFLSPNF